MKSWLKHTLAMTLSLALCISGVSPQAWAEGVERTQEATETQEAATPAIMVRTNIPLDNAPSAADEGWLTCEYGTPTSTDADAQPTSPITTFEATLTAEAGGVEYRLLDETGAWPDEWARNGACAQASTGAHGIQMRLVDEASTQYDLWYRSLTATGTWLGWAHGGEDSGSALSPIVAIQFMLTSLGEQPDVDSTATFELPATEDESRDPGQSPAQDQGQEQAQGQEQEQAPEQEQGQGQDEAATAKGAEAATTTTPRVESTQVQTQTTSIAEERARAEAKNQEQSNLEDKEREKRQAAQESTARETAAEKTATPTTTARQQSAKAPASQSTTNASTTAAQTTGLEAMADTPTVEYQTHVQTYGWQEWKQNGDMAGTSGQSKRLEAMRIRLKNADGHIQYETHAQTYGWLDQVSDGELSGTTGQSKRLEAIRISLTGNIANTYDVWYRAHVQRIGWQAWVCNGATAGTSGRSLRVEGLEILLVKKGDTIPANSVSGSNYHAIPQSSSSAVYYQTHAQTIGWQEEVSNGATAGTSGQSKRLEALRITLGGVSGGVTYRTHVQRIGWQSWRSDGEVAGTSGQSLRLEAIEVKLTGDAADSYDIWYRCHVQRVGWMGWAKNGARAGSQGYSYRMEAMQIKLLPKGSAEPSDDDSSTSYPFMQKSSTASNRLNGVDISGWDSGIDIEQTDGDFFIVKATEGVSTTGKSATRFNPQYDEWADEVLDSGRLLGFYHYATGGNAVTEADTFYEAIKDYKGRAIACLDWEGDGNKLFGTGMDVQWCKKFLDRLKSRFGGTPFLYTSKSVCNQYNWSSVSSSYPLWGAEYANYKNVYGYVSEPWQSTSPWGSWGTYPTIFQYTGNGVLGKQTGIDSFDFNLFYGNRTDWNKYVA